MKRTPSKLVALLLALILCISAVYVTAFASEDVGEGEAAQPKIISQNVMYGGNFSLMFAVDASTCSGDTVTLKVYDAEPTADATPVWSSTMSTAADTTAINGIECFTFTTPGVAAKDMDKNYYITATSAGVVSEVKKYSVAEYLYERLYGNEVAFGTSALELAQAKLYFSTLEFGKNAQDLLFNYDEDTTNDRTTFVTDLCYVTINSKNGIKGTLNDGKTALLVNKGDSISVGSATVKFNGKEWEAGEFAVQSISGSDIISTETLTENTIVANSHLIIDPTRFFSVSAEPEAETFDGMTSINTSFYTSQNVTSMELADVDGDTKLKYTFAPTNTSNHYAYFKLGSASTDAKMVVWEADVDFDNMYKDGQAAGANVGNAVRITIGAIAFNINVNTTGLTCYDGPDNWYATISDNTDHKAHIRIEYFETTDSSGTAVFDTNFYVDGKLMKAANAKKYAAYSASKSVDNVTQVMVASDYNIGGEYYFDNVKLFKTYEPEELLLNEYYTFEGETAVDSSKIYATTLAALSIVDGVEGNAMKFALGTSAQERVSFYPLTTEENANKAIFEFTFTDHFATSTASNSTVLTFYAGTEKVYDFRLNNGKLLTADSNSISWGLQFTPGNTYTLRFELWMNGTTLEVNVWCNGVQVKRPSNYGSNVTGRSEDLIDGITKLEWLDGSTGSTGYYIVDNVRFTKLNTND